MIQDCSHYGAFYKFKVHLPSLIAHENEASLKRVLNRFFGSQDFPYLKLKIQDYEAKSGRDSGLKVFAWGGTPKITIKIMGLHEILGQDYGIEEPYRGTSLK